jgi:hypothetical protein
MAAPTKMTIPTLQSLGDLTKEDDQMIIILRTVQFWGTHVVISRVQVGVSFLFFILFYYNVAYCRIFLLPTQPVPFFFRHALIESKKIDEPVISNIEQIIEEDRDLNS